MKRYFLFFGGATVCWMVFLFCMSAQGTASSAQSSAGLTSLLASLIYEPATGFTEELLQPVSLLVRKTAHIASYAVLFLLSYGTVHFYKKTLSAKKKWLFSYGWTVFYAMTDEIHQIFSGRGASVVDVIIDAMGALLATAILFGIGRVLQTRGFWPKLGWTAATLFAAFGIYSSVFLLFHPEVIQLFF